MAVTAAELLVKISADTSDAEGALGKLSSSLDKGIGGIATKAALGAGVALAGLGGVVGKLGLDFNSFREQSEIAFTTMLGSAQKAKQFVGELAAFAAKTPFELRGLTAASQQLLAFGFRAQDVIPMVTAVGDAVSGLGGGADVMQGVITALGQMKAKGKASAEELMQLAERGIPAWQYLAQAMGVSIPEAMKRVSAGAVSAETAIGAVTQGMERQFGGMMARQSQTWSGLLSTLHDTFEQLAGTVMGPIFGQLSAALQRFTAWLANPAIGQAATRIGEALGGALSRVAGLVGGTVLPALVRLGGWVLGTGLPALQALADRVGPLLDRALGAAAGLVTGTVLPALGQLAGWVRGTGLPALQALADRVGPLLGQALSAFGPLVTGTVLPALERLAAWVSGTALPALQGFAAQAGPLLDEALGQVGPFVTGTVLPALERLSSWFSGTALPALQAFLSGAWQPLAQGLGLVGPVVDALLAGLAPLLPQFQQLGQIVATQLLPALGQVWSALQSQLLPALRLLAPIVGGLLVGAIGLLLGALNGLVGLLVGVLPGVIQAAVGAIQVLLGAVHLVAAVVAGVVAIVANLLQGDWAGAWAAARNMVDEVASALGAIVGGLANLVLGAIRGMVGGVLGLISGFVQSIIGFFSTLYHELVGGSIIPDLVTGIIDWIGRLPGRVGQIIASLVTGVLTQIGGLATGMLTKAGEIVSNLASGISSGVTTVTTAIGGIVTAITGAFSGAGSLLYSAGTAVVQGLIDGIGAMLEQAKQAAESVANAVTEKVKGVFHIGSPSRLMEDYGRWTMEGLALGIRGAEGEVTRAAGGAVEAALARFGGLTLAGAPPLAAGPATLPPTGADAPAITLNLTVNAPAGAGEPEALARAIRDEVSAALREAVAAAIQRRPPAARTLPGAL